MGEKKRRFALIAIALGVVLCPLAGMMVFEYIDTPQVYYRSYSDMLADGALTRGWIPAFVPTTARDFEERHNIDTNASWLRFMVPADDIAAMEAALVKVERDALVLPRYPGGKWREAWPRELAQGGTISDRFTTYRFDYTSIMGDTTRPERDFVAIDHDTGTVWHWRP